MQGRWGARPFSGFVCASCRSPVVVDARARREARPCKSTEIMCGSSAKDGPEDVVPRRGPTTPLPTRSGDAAWGVDRLVGAVFARH
jgi:hypothetical protein